MLIKSSLATTLARDYPALSEKDSGRVVTSIIKQLSNALSHGKRVEIRGFGSLSLHYHPPRVAHNPKTRARIMTQAKYSPHFKPGKALRERVDRARLNVPIRDEKD